MRQLKYIPAIIALTFLGLSCNGRTTSDDDTVLAVLGPHTLTLEDVKRNTPSELFAQDSLRIIEQYRNNWIRKQLKAREARRLGLDQAELVRERIQRAEETILVDAFNEAVYRQISDPVSRSEAQSYYEANKDKFILAEQTIRYRHMIASSLENAQNARNALQRGVSWNDVANRYSVNAQHAVALSGQFHPVSDAASGYPQMHSFLQRMGVTEISPIRRINDHFHFVQLIENRDPGEHPEMEWIIDQITEWLTLDRRRKHLRSVEQNLFLQAEANNELIIYDINSPDRRIELQESDL
ncbi:peptidyl-prolyl cis-trans isomerase [Balneolaceae bacterium ANBcel3]|nr:peptidyl-prolyl cis-trans isomerase [Balneolaceae bacterium ANBcel3]